MKILKFALIVSMILLVGSVWAQELYDPDYTPTVDNPAYTVGSGPVVLVDEAHKTCAAAERFNPNRSCTGEQIPKTGLMDILSQDIKERFFDAVGDRAGDIPRNSA